MARRYEFPDAGWELIKDLVAPEQKWADLEVMIGWCSTASFGSSAPEPPGVIFRNVSARGRRFINGSVTGETTVRLTEYLSDCTSG